MKYEYDMWRFRSVNSLFFLSRKGNVILCREVFLEGISRAVFGFRHYKNGITKVAAAMTQHIQTDFHFLFFLLFRGVSFQKPHSLNPRPASRPRLGSCLGPERRAVAIASSPWVVRPVIFGFGIQRRWDEARLWSGLGQRNLVRRPAVSGIERHSQAKLAELRGGLARSWGNRGHFSFVAVNAPFFRQESGVWGVCTGVKVVVFLS